MIKMSNLTNNSLTLYILHIFLLLFKVENEIELKYQFQND